MRRTRRRTDLKGEEIKWECTTPWAFPFSFMPSEESAPYIKIAAK
jgi:hypothetical protein